MGASAARSCEKHRRFAEIREWRLIRKAAWPAIASESRRVRRNDRASESVRYHKNMSADPTTIAAMLVGGTGFPG